MHIQVNFSAKLYIPDSVVSLHVLGGIVGGAVVGMVVGVVGRAGN